MAFVSEWMLSDTALGVYLTLGLAMFLTLVLSSQRLSREKSWVYPAFLLCFSTTVATMVLARSPYLHAGDAPGELYAATHNSSGLPLEEQLELHFPANYFSLPILTVLPRILNVVAGIAPQETFRYLYLPMYVLTPVVLWLGLSKLLNARLAFVASFFFLAHYTFLGIVVSSARETVGGFLAVLMVMMILGKQVDREPALAFSATLILIGLTLSNYSMTLVVSGMLVAYFVVARLLRYPCSCFGFLPLVVAIPLTYYGMASSAEGVLADGVRVLFNVLTGRISWAQLQLLQGVESPSVYGYSPVYSTLIKFPSWVSYGCILAGAFQLLRNSPNGRLKIASISTLVYFGIVGLLTGSPAYNIDRAFQILLLILSGTFAVGIDWLTSALTNTIHFLRRPGILQGLFLLMLLTAQIGLFAELTGHGVSSTLDYHAPDEYLFHAQDFADGRWLTQSLDPNAVSSISSDYDGPMRLYYYGISSLQVNFTGSDSGVDPLQAACSPGAILYLHYNNVVWNRIVYDDYLQNGILVSQTLNQSRLQTMNRIYDSGYSLFLTNCFDP
jgi:uncharacterized membrane protein